MTKANKFRVLPACGNGIKREFDFVFSHLNLRIKLLITLLFRTRRMNAG